MSELKRLLAQYGEGYTPEVGADDAPTTADVMANYRPPGKGDYLQRKVQDYIDYLGRKAQASNERPMAEWRGPSGWEYIPVPAKNTHFGDALLTAMMAPMGGRLGMGGSGGGIGFLRRNDVAVNPPSTYHVPGGLGIVDSWPLPMGGSGWATQPREILGGVVAPMLSATKRDAEPMADAEKFWEEARRYYTGREHAQYIARDIAGDPIGAARQIPMFLGYGYGAPEGGAALGALRYLSTLARAPEPPPAPIIPAPPLGAQPAARSAP